MTPISYPARIREPLPALTSRHLKTRCWLLFLDVGERNVTQGHSRLLAWYGTWKRIASASRAFLGGFLCSHGHSTGRKQAGNSLSRHPVSGTSSQRI